MFAKQRFVVFGTTLENDMIKNICAKFGVFNTFWAILAIYCTNHVD